jgi:hypothetical protein
MMWRETSRPERRAAVPVQRFHAALGKVAPKTREESRYMELGSGAIRLHYQRVDAYALITRF